MSEISPDIIAAIEAELDQRTPKPQSLAGFVLQLEEHLAQLKRATLHHAEKSVAPLSHVVGMIATGIECLSYYGVSGGVVATCDTTEAEVKETKRQRRTA